MPNSVVLASAIDVARNCNIEAAKLQKLMPSLEHGRPLSAQEAKAVVSGMISLYEHLSGHILLQATVMQTADLHNLNDTQDIKFVPLRIGIWNRVRLNLIRLLERL